MGQLKEVIVLQHIAEDVHPGSTVAKNLLDSLRATPGSTSSRLLLAPGLYDSHYLKEVIPLDWYSYHIRARRTGSEEVEVTLTPNTPHNEPLRLYVVDERGIIVGKDVYPKDPLVITLNSDRRILPLLEGTHPPQDEDDHPSHVIHGFLVFEDTPASTPKREDTAINRPEIIRPTRIVH